MSDWFNEAKKEYLFDLAVACKMSEEQVGVVYNQLAADGYIDYDVEKEILWNEYGQELEESDE